MSKIFEAVQQAQEQTEAEDLVRTVLLGLEDPSHNEAPESTSAETRLPIPADPVKLADFREFGAPGFIHQEQPEQPVSIDNAVDSEDVLTGVLPAISDPIQDYVESLETSETSDPLWVRASVQSEGRAASAQPVVIPFRPPAAAQPVIALAHVRTVPLRVAAQSPLLPFDTANWRASEEYRSIRTRILKDPRAPRTILLTSAGAGDGKSVTAINIAGALSLKAEMNVLLMDCDFRRSSVHRQLSIDQVPGVTDVLLGYSSLQDSLIRAEQFPNLYILPAGSRIDNPSDLLETPAWVDLREHITSLFRYVIVDSPPIAAVSEYDLLEAAADAVMVIVRQDHTRLEAFLKALSSVPSNKLLGVALNCVDEWCLSSTGKYYDYGEPGKASAQSDR